MTTLQSSVDALRQQPLPSTAKGLGRLARGRTVTAASLGADRPSLFDPELTMPLMVLREDNLAHNIAAMASYCAAAGVRLSPHGKTTMAPQLFARQLDAGAWAITAANITEVQIYREFGVPRVLLANELTDRAGAALARRRDGRGPWLRVLRLRRQPGRRAPARGRGAGTAPAAARAGRAGPARRPGRLPELAEALAVAVGGRGRARPAAGRGVRLRGQHRP